MREVRTGKIYRHFKGSLYQIVAVATHSETNEKYVVYQALYGDMQVWVRPYDMFVGEVDHVKYPDVHQKYRFELVNTILNAAGSGAVWDKAHYNDRADNEAIDSSLADSKSGSDNRVADVGKDGMNTMQYADTIRQTDKEEELSDDADNREMESERGIDSRLLEFLDAPTYQEKINYLNLIRNNIDDELINNIAAAMDITVNEGPLDARFFSLRSCLLTKAKYECARR